jgi:transposase
MAVYEIAPLFQVSVSYVYKALARRRVSGESAARAQRCTVRPRLAAYADVLRARLLSHADTTIAELQSWLLAEHGMSVSYGSVWTALDRLNLTHKKSRSARRNKIGPMLPKRALPGASSSPA